MATSKKGSKKSTAKKSSKKSTAKNVVETTGRKKKKKIMGGDPIIITGGSIYVDFYPPFDDENTTTKLGPRKKVKQVKAPVSSMMITGVEVTDAKGNILSSYTLPTDLDGKCIIYINGR